MQLVSALSTADDPTTALAEVAEQLRAGLRGKPADLALVFAGWSGEQCDALAARLPVELGATQLIGCSAGGLIGAGREVEQQGGLAAAALSLADVDLRIRHLAERDLPGPDAPPTAWRELLGRDGEPLAPIDCRGLCLLADPFTTDVDRLLTGLDYAYPAVPKFGGLASGGATPAANRMLLGDRSLLGGALLISFGPGVRIETVVAQGCMPLGRVGTITRADGHYMRRIDDQPALHFIQEQIAELATAEESAQGLPLFLGMAMDPLQLDQPEAGEFLIRHLLGYDQGTGAVAVGAELGAGRRVQLHLRDAKASAADLRRSLAAAADPAPFGALLFSCLGRGAQLYGEPDHDTRCFAERYPGAPLAGFFCGGEIGPVSGATYLHGYTSAFALLREEPTEA